MHNPKIMTPTNIILILSLLLAVTFFTLSCSTTDTRPTGLMCELLENPQTTEIFDTTPEFSWIFNAKSPGSQQSAYCIQVATDNKFSNAADIWDSGKTESNQSSNIEYAGALLSPGNTYYWRVKTWDDQDNELKYSKPQSFTLSDLAGDQYQTTRYPLQKTPVAIDRIVHHNDGTIFLDFGRDAFGTLQLAFKNVKQPQTLTIALGEKLKSPERIDPKPGGTIRYREIQLEINPKTSIYTLTIPADKRNTREHAIHMPDYIGEVLPFRYAEIRSSESEIDTSQTRMLSVHYPFNENASYFDSADPVINAVWDLCKYSIKATSFCGVYLDGDRERIPYEADAYINQLGHYCVDREYTMARYSHEYLIENPTWPTEWILHSVLMAWADYMYTGNTESMQHYYDDLKAKSLMVLARKDGLISTTTGLVTDDVLKSIHFEGNMRDIVDWPPGSFTEGGTGERDNFEMTDYNTVVNAFHYQTLVIMSNIAAALNKTDEAKQFADQAAKVKTAFNKVFINKKLGIYKDGESTNHSALHANMVPLAFNMVPEEYLPTVVEFIKSRGMACSVYGSQYLLEALYNAGEDDYALWLMTNDSDRSWPHMINNVGTTITLEAWDWKYKNNLDWNHAWGAAPANIIPRYLVGVQPLEPGFSKILIKPQVGDLESGTATVPTIKGPVKIKFEQVIDESFTLDADIPDNTTAQVWLPSFNNQTAEFELDGNISTGELSGNFIMTEITGNKTLKITKK